MQNGFASSRAANAAGTGTDRGTRKDGAALESARDRRERSESRQRK